MNTDTSVVLNPPSQAPCQPPPANPSAEEATQFLMGFSVDAEARERFANDKEQFLKQADLSEAAKEILRTSNANFLLRELNNNKASALLTVAVLETVPLM